MLTVGLTGNFGMGKSTVLRMFKGFGAAVLEADAVVKTLLEDRDVLDRLREALGGSAFSAGGRLDRQRVAELIFKDEKLKDAVEEILHPLVSERIKDFCDDLAGENPATGIVIIEIPLLFEKGFDKRFQKNITVFASENTAFERLERSGIKRGYAEMIMKAQMPVAEKVRMSDFSINNNGTPEETRLKVREIYGMLMEGIKDKG